MTVLGEASQKALKLKFPLVKISRKKTVFLGNEGITRMSATGEDLRMQGSSPLYLFEHLASAKAAKWPLETNQEQPQLHRCAFNRYAILEQISMAYGTCHAVISMQNVL